jgi:hypothetical protein
MEENTLQDLFESYVSDLYKLREGFHSDLTSTARELSQAMDDYSRRSEEALTSFMERVAARGAELEVAAAVRFDQFRGLLKNGRLPDVRDGSLAHTPTDPDQERVAAAAERAVADSLPVQSEKDRKPTSGRPMLVAKSNPAA